MFDYYYFYHYNYNVISYYEFVFLKKVNSNVVDPYYVGDSSCKSSIYVGR